MNPTGNFCTALEHTIRDEARYGWKSARKRWERPLAERVSSGRAIGPLRIAGRGTSEHRDLLHFVPSVEDMAVFKEGDRIRLSLNDPMGDDWIEAVFLGLTPKGLSVTIPPGVAIPTETGWCLDEEVVDLSDLYLRALNELAGTFHGREVVLPTLLEGTGNDMDLDAHGEHLTTLESGEMDDSQSDAVARCLASGRFHLVQGPPGTGKTHALARLVRELVTAGQRVLVTAFTHRAIHHALRGITPLVDCPIYKVSDPFPHDGQGIVFKDRFEDTGLLDHPGPYVIGATPFALFTSRAGEASFDVAVIDETSQMRIEAAIMPMLRAQRWFFFGDRQQLPPVVLRPVDDPAEDSIFATLSSHGGHTMLKTTYRMNDALVSWPSENFYQGELKSFHQTAGRRLHLTGAGDPDGLLDANPSLVRSKIPHEGCRASSPQEADACAELIERLLDGGLSPGEIGVVVPFRAQAARIRSLLGFRKFQRHPDISDLTVDTIERFQGQEREVMIVSFVVSDQGFMDKLGVFLTYPQRLNVAVTRARSKVILLHSTVFRQWLERVASGKSLVLLYRALLSARLHPEASVLVLTHNKPLRHELERRTRHLGKLPNNLRGLTFFQWAAECLGPWRETMWWPGDIERALTRIQMDFQKQAGFRPHS